jgi:hypothetical protein
MALAVGHALRETAGAGPARLEAALRERFLAWAASPDNDRPPGTTCRRDQRHGRCRARATARTTAGTAAHATAGGRRHHPYRPVG